MRIHRPWLTFLGSFIADLTVRAPQLPAWGESVLGTGFTVGAGGKGSNQAVAAARLGARAGFITRVGRDAFGDLARATWRREGVDTEFCTESATHGTGAAAVIVHEGRGENAIVVDPGSGMQLTVDDLEAAAGRIMASAVFVTQLEVPLPVVSRALAIAHGAGVTTVLNPAPALPLPPALLALCDYLTPNEHEASTLTGIAVTDVASADRAAAALLERGAGCVIVTLGANGALVKRTGETVHVPAVDAGPVVETTGAGDAFNGALAVALSEGRPVAEAARFACVAAGLSVTRAGTSASIPTRAEVDRRARA
ncbi:MAG: ribokinase [Gemmatimonadetes bacterium]|nr:ribokinase [Gemmatimonadota bacterium]